MRNGLHYIRTGTDTRLRPASVRLVLLPPLLLPRRHGRAADSRRGCEQLWQKPQQRDGRSDALLGLEQERQSRVSKGSPPDHYQVRLEQVVTPEAKHTLLGV
jgi:hypothetical protein